MAVHGKKLEWPELARPEVSEESLRELMAKFGDAVTMCSGGEVVYDPSLGRIANPLTLTRKCTDVTSDTDAPDRPPVLPCPVIARVPWRPLGQSHYVPAPWSEISDLKTPYVPSNMSVDALKLGVRKGIERMPQYPEWVFERVVSFLTASLGPFWGSIAEPVMSYPDAIATLTLDKSPGWPYYYGAADKEEALRKYGDDVQKRVNRILCGEPVPCIFTFTLKDELRAAPKVAEKKTRVFSACDLHHLLASKQLFEKQNKALQSSIGQHPVTIGISFPGPSFAQLILSFNKGGNSGDEDGCDQRFPLVIARAIAAVRARYLPKEYTPAVRHLYESVYCGYVVCLGVIYHYLHNKSGWENTGHDNSAALAAKLVVGAFQCMLGAAEIPVAERSMAQHEQCKVLTNWNDADYAEYLQMRVNGDDLVAKCHIPGIELQDIVRELRSLNVIVELDAPVPHDCLDLVYLSHSLKLRHVSGFGDVYVVAGNREKLWSSIFWLRKSAAMSIQEASVAHLLGLRICLFPWAKDFEYVEALLTQHLASGDGGRPLVVTPVLRQLLTSRLTEAQILQMHIRTEAKSGGFVFCPSDALHAVLKELRSPGEEKNWLQSNLGQRIVPNSVSIPCLMSSLKKVPLAPTAPVTKAQVQSALAKIGVAVSGGQARAMVRAINPSIQSAPMLRVPKSSAPSAIVSPAVVPKFSPQMNKSSREKSVEAGLALAKEVSAEAKERRKREKPAKSGGWMGALSTVVEWAARLAPVIVPLLVQKHQPTQMAIQANPSLLNRLKQPGLAALLPVSNSTPPTTSPVQGVPVALPFGLAGKVGLTDLKTVSTGGSTTKMVARGLDFLTSYTGTGSEAVGDLLLQLSLNPLGGDLSATRIANFCRSFRKYRIIRMMIIGEPLVGTNQGGAFFGFINCDPADQNPPAGSGVAAIQDAAAQEGSDTWNVWNVGAVRYCPDKSGLELYTNAEGSDVRFTSPGNFCLYAASAALPASALLNLYVAYEVEMDIPMLNASVEDNYGGLAQWIQAIAGNTTSIWPSTGASVPAMSATSTLPVTTAYDATNTAWRFYLPVKGRYLINLYITGTGISANGGFTKYTGTGVSVVASQFANFGQSGQLNGFMYLAIDVSDAAIAAGTNYVAPAMSSAPATITNVQFYIVSVPPSATLRSDGELALRLVRGQKRAGVTMQDYERCVDILVRRELDRSSTEKIDPAMDSGSDSSGGGGDDIAAALAVLSRANAMVRAAPAPVLAANLPALQKL
jgi:hypothetical protein